MLVRQFLLLFLAMSTFHAVEAAERLEEIVVTAAKLDLKRREVSASIGTIDSDNLQLISHTHINESLHRIPGTWISRGNGQEHLTAIRSPVLTGAGSCGAFLMAQDGISLRAPGFCNVNELFESASELAGRIEVIKGPASSTHGSNALHGLINVITPMPNADDRRLQIEAGANDYHRGHFTFSTDQLRIDLSGTSDGGYKDESGFDQQKLLVKHIHTTSNLIITSTLAATNLNQETAGFIRGHEAYKDSGLKRDNPNPEAYRDADSLRLSARIEKNLNQGQLVFTPYYRNVEMEFLQHFLPGQAIEKNSHDSLGLHMLWTNEPADLSIGLELETTDGYLEEFQPGPTIGSAFLVGTIPEGLHYDYEVRANLAGAFIRYVTDLGDQLSVTTNLRYQYIDYDYDNRMLDGRSRDDGTDCGFGGCRFTRPADRSDRFNDWAPSIGLTYQLASGNQLYGSIARGFRAPQATELYRLQAGQDVSRIDSVELNSLEIGYRGEHGALTLDISAYAMDKRNFIFRDTSRRNVDNGKTTHRGVELDLSWQINPVLELEVAATYARHKYDNNPALSNTLIDGNTIDTAPRTLGSARLTWHVRQNLPLELEWVHIGRYYQDPENNNRYEGHDLIHLRSAIQVNDRISLSLRLMNLTDRDYAERADFAFGTDRYFVGTPRSVFAGINFRF